MRDIKFTAILHIQAGDRVDVCHGQSLQAVMAPMALEPPSHPLKRTSSIAQFADSASKKTKGDRSIRHHKAVWDLQKEQRQTATFQDDGAVQDMLTRSITLALEAVGFGAATPQAMESFRGDVEECTRAFTYILCR